MQPQWLGEEAVGGRDAKESLSDGMDMSNSTLFQASTDFEKMRKPLMLYRSLSRRQLAIQRYAMCAIGLGHRSWKCQLAHVEFVFTIAEEESVKYLLIA